VFPCAPAPVGHSAAFRGASRTAASRSHRAGFVAALSVALLIGAIGAPAAAARTTPPVANPADADIRADATTTRLEGIDVSHWQGTINWTKVAAAGKTFAIIKASQDTTYVDPMYATNHAAAKAAGLWTGAYHFAQPTTALNDAVAEADHFAAVVTLGTKDLIPALDLEVSGGLSIAALQTWVASWLNEVALKTGVRPMIYTSPAFWTKYMGDSSALADAGYKTLWIAHWNVTSPLIPANNWGGHGWTFWQYSNCGTVPGISGCVDLDRFNGADLAPAAYSVFSLLPASSVGYVKQGQSSSAVVKIIRTNFPSGVALDVTGLPAGSIAAFTSNPTTDATASLKVTTPTDPTITPTGTYPLTITGSGDGLVRTTKMSLVVSDGIPPTVVAPYTSLIGGRIGTSSIPVRVSWSASDPSGIASQALQRSIGGATWTSVSLPTITSQAVVENLPIAKGTQQRARATDRKSNTSPYVAGPIVRTALFQQSASAITYSGTWHTVSVTSASGGSERYATAAGASATFSFTGSNIAWVSTRGAGRGSAKVYLDGTYITTVNLSSTVGQSRAIVFARNWARNASHTLRIVVVGTAGHPRVDVDAFVRLSLS
jgi:lysozyme